MFYGRWHLYHWLLKCQVKNNVTGEHRGKDLLIYLQTKLYLIKLHKMLFLLNRFCLQTTLHLHGIHLIYYSLIIVAVYQPQLYRTPVHLRCCVFVCPCVCVKMKFRTLLHLTLISEFFLCCHG